MKEWKDIVKPSNATIFVEQPKRFKIQNMEVHATIFTERPPGLQLSEQCRNLKFLNVFVNISCTVKLIDNQANQGLRRYVAEKLSVIEPKPRFLLY